MSFGGVPEESPEEKRRRKAAERRARADRMMANQEFTADRTAFLARQFGSRTGGGGSTSSPSQTLLAFRRGFVPGLFSAFNARFGTG